MLVEKINKDLIGAMKEKNEAKLRAIRAIKSAFLLAGAETGSKSISDDIALKVMQKMAKQRKDSMEIFLKENRQDLAKKEAEELSIIETYLPAQISQEALYDILKQIITDVSAESMKDIGKIMPLAMKQLAGQADGKTINQTLKSLLPE